MQVFLITETPNIIHSLHNFAAIKSMAIALKTVTFSIALSHPVFENRLHNNPFNPYSREGANKFLI